MFTKSTIIIGFIFMAYGSINAQVPQLINYQAMLTDAAENPVNGNRTIQFSIYDAPSGGTAIWSETQTVTVTNGLFSELLGSTNPIPYSVFNGGDKYLALKISNDPAEMTPRKRLVSVGYAFRANDANNVTGKSNCFPSVGSVGIGTLSPGSKLEVVDGIMTSGSGLEGGQFTFLDGDRQGGWEVDNYGTKGEETLRFFRDRGFNDVHNALILKNSGNVGIGTDPTEKLQVNGTIHSLSGGFRFPDGTTQATAAASSGPADNLGNHTATRNIKLNGHWLSGDGNDEGVFVHTNGNVGIGTSDPSGAKIKVIQNSTERAGFFQIVNANSSSEALLANTNNSREAIYATTYGTGRAGYIGIGNENNSSHALEVQTNGKNGCAIYGYASNSNTIYNYGGMFQAAGSVGEGVNSFASGLSGRGIKGVASGDLGIGVWGEASSTANEINYGGWFLAKGVRGCGVQSYADGEQGVGIRASGGKNGLAGDFMGKIRCSVLEITGGSDLAEPFDIQAEDAIKPGMIVSIDPENPGKLKLAHQAYDPCVAGIISGAGNIAPGMLMGQAGTLASCEHPVALSGRVYCWAETANGQIRPGDLLTTSATPGHAMKVTDFVKARGAIIGKAMTPLETDSGLVLVLVTLQ